MVIGALFGIILSLTLLREIKGVSAWLKTHFPLLMQFIPTWSFFAPIPNMLDYHLYYRGVKKSGEMSEWQELTYLSGERPWFACVWNPSKRFSKGLLDIAHDLLRFSNQFDNPLHICSSLPYLHLLNFLNGYVQDTDLEKIQFTILTESRLQAPQLAFLSEMHPLRRN